MQNHVGGDPADIECQSYACAALGKLVNDDGAGNGIAACSAVLFGEVHTDKSGFAEFVVYAPVKAVLVHPFVSRGNLFLCEFLYHITDHGLFFSKFDEHNFFSNIAVLRLYSGTAVFIR